MNEKRWQPVILWSIKIVHGSVFVAAGVLKSGDMAGFAQEIAGYRMLPGIARILAVTLPGIELAVGACLMALPLRHAWLSSAWLVFLLTILAFTVAVAAAMARGLDISCGCFGTDLDTTLSAWTLARNATLLTLGTVALFWRMPAFTGTRWNAEQQARPSA